MKKVFALMFLAIAISHQIFAQNITNERVSVSAEIYRASDNAYTGNTTVTLRMARGVGQATMVLEINPWPGQGNIGEFFDQSTSSNSTFQTVVAGNDCAWIASSCPSNKRESERRYWALQQTSSGEHYMLLYRMPRQDGQMEFWTGYYLKLSSDAEFKLRLYMVEKGSQYGVFKNLDSIRAID